MKIVRAGAAVRAGLFSAACNLLFSLSLVAGPPNIHGFWNLLVEEACERALWDLDYLKSVSQEESAAAPGFRVTGGEAMPQLQRMLTDEAESFVNKSVAPFENSRTLRPPQNVSISLVYSLIPPSDLSHFGFDRWQRAFWVYLPQTDRGPSWQAFAVEFGRILFRHNLRLINPEFEQWENEVLALGQSLPPKERRELETFLKQLTKPLAETDPTPLTMVDQNHVRALARFPWHALVRDYEVAFGLLFAAMSSRNLPTAGNFVDSTFFQKEIFAPNMEEEEPWRFCIGFPPVLQSSHCGGAKTMYNFSTGLRPSVRWVWINVLQGTDPKSQVAFMERLFQVFARQISLRRQQESRGLNFEPRLNFFILDSLNNR